MLFALTDILFPPSGQIPNRWRIYFCRLGYFWCPDVIW